MAREVLKGARSAAGMTQQQVADHLGVSLRYYQMIEKGSSTGNFAIWDDLEDLMGIHQRELRACRENRHDQEASP
ncbi:helix-turn-helix domain-containing protein [Adlercreutzia equolifaciens]|uniref:helix-turn-helix domain-containing protein n=1 Tax=Adlercreutzia equolifaciens TaxID=446660 RepID=UPI003A8F55CC